MPMVIAGLIFLGLITGVLAGLLGIAGGIFLTPALVFILGFSQKGAQGTTLAVLLPPVGLGAAYFYWRHGNVDIKAAAFIAIGLFVGGIFGALLANKLPGVWVQRVFGVFTIAVGIKLLLGK